MSSFDTCNIEDFVAEVTPQIGSLEEAASTQELLIQQIEGYLQRFKAAVCADLESLSGGGGASTFLALTDTPASYAAAAGDVATVNAGQTALEFTTPAAPGGLPDLVAGVEVASGRQIGGADSYFKLTNVGALPNVATKLVAHGIPLTATFWSIKGTATNGAGVFIALPFESVTNSASCLEILATAAGDYSLRTAINFSAFSGYLIAEYTK